VCGTADPTFAAQQQREDERWTEVQYVHSEHPVAEDLRRRLVSTRECGLQPLMPPPSRPYSLYSPPQYHLSLPSCFPFVLILPPPL